MSNYEVISTEVALIKKGSGILSDTVTRVSIEDDGGGAFVRIFQPFNSNEIANTIDLDLEEINPLMNVALNLLENYNRITKNIEEEN